MRTSNRVQPAFYTRVQPASEGRLNSYLSEFEVLEKMADRGRMRTDAEIPLVLNVWSEDSIQRQLQGSLRNEVPYKNITAVGECCAQKMECWPPNPKISFPFCLIPSSYNAVKECVTLSVSAEHCRAVYAV